MADDHLTRATVQALSSVEKVVTPTTLPTVVDRVEIDPKLNDSLLLGSDAQMVAKKKRGRPPRNPGVPSAAALAAAKKRAKKEKDDEDVCFICFDGGSLVLCDRRDCPKAYHPVCVKREESFFQPNIMWNCGWHLCNVCQRSALFMCYTCPYSLCKGCVRQADIFCVRGNKGFCKTCMTTVMLIENMPQENKELVKVDFDDKTSWEYLFKVYWIYLKQKESLTVEELTQAVHPWKGSDLDHKNHYRQLHSRCSNKVSEVSSSYTHLEVNASKRRKTRGQSQAIIIESQQVDKTDGDKASCLRGNTDWASKELLEFVSHMKNGDVSVLSQFDAQALLLEYIRTNSLRDPRQKCQIVCDKRLENLFGKERVGHFEMLKLIEYHFKEESRTNSVIRGAASDPLVGMLEPDGISGDMQTPSGEMKRQTRKNGDERGRQKNLDSYAAIDVHNINLIYLKRSVLEKLMVDADKFHDKVVGSIVRIKISSNDQKQDMHRLVRIIGTTKATESNKIEDKLENIMLKILNLNKIEDITIDAISEQEFSEDECKRLRQSIKLGLVERITVGEIQEKIIALQTVRVSNWLEAEIIKLNHLRDRASEMGHRKELRENVEKIELLQMPEERQRRINDIAEVHADPKMDPSYGSDDDSGESDVKKRDEPVTPKYNFNSRVELISPTRVTDTSGDRRAKTPRTLTVNGERKRKVTAKSYVRKVEGATRPLELSPKPERVDATPRLREEHGNQEDSSAGSGERGVIKVGSNSQSGFDTSKNPSTEISLGSDISELEKIWHYQDPLGNVQGPFCLFQLRKWNSNAYFPPDLRVWRINDTPEQSILLTHVLRKQHPIDSQNHMGSQFKDEAKSDDGQLNSTEELSSNGGGAPWIGCKSNEGGHSYTPDIVAASDNNAESTTTSDRSSQQLSDNPTGLGPPCGQNIIAQLVESLFSIEEPCDTFATSSSPTMHMTPETESYNPSSPVPKSDDNLDLENNAAKSGPPSSQNVGGPDILTSWGVTSSGTKATNLSSTMVKSEPPDIVENNQHVASNVGKDLSGNWEIGSRAIEFTTLIPGAVQVKNESLKPRAGDKSLSISSHSHVLGHGSSTSWDTPIEASCIPSTAPIELFGISGFPSGIRDNGSLKTHAIQNKHCIPSGGPEQNSGTSWSTISACEILFSDLPGSSSQKPPLSEEQKHCVTANIQGQDFGSTWRALATGIEFSDLPTTSLKLGDEPLGWQPIELSTLGDESVSDLLSEVEAMESLRGISSLTSMMNCGDDSIDSPGDDCFSPLGGLSPNLDAGRNDALSSTADIQFHVQRPVSMDHGPPHKPFLFDINDPPRNFCVLTNPSPEADAEAEVKPPPLVSMPLHDPISKAPAPTLLPPPPPSPPPPPPPLPPQKPPSPPGQPPSSTMSVDRRPSTPRIHVPVRHPEVVVPQNHQKRIGVKKAAVDTRANGLEPTEEENAKSTSTGPILGSPNMHWPASHMTTTGGVNVNWNPSMGSQDTRPYPISPRHRHSGPKERSHHNQHNGVESDFGKSRASWSRQSSFGGGSSRPSHSQRGPRVCKFYESGCCKKGASCKYLHP